MSLAPKMAMKSVQQHLLSPVGIGGWGLTSRDALSCIEGDTDGICRTKDLIVALATVL